MGFSAILPAMMFGKAGGLCLLGFLFLIAPLWAKLPSGIELERGTISDLSVSREKISFLYSGSVIEPNAAGNGVNKAAVDKLPVRIRKGSIDPNAMSFEELVIVAKQLCSKGREVTGTINHPAITRSKNGHLILVEASQLTLCDYSNLWMVAEAGVGRVEKVQEWLARGADPDSNAESNGYTALMLAAGAGHTEVVKVLLKAGADPDLQSKRWQNTSALILASHNGHAECAEVLLKYDADPNIKDAGGQTTLISLATIPSGAGSKWPRTTELVKDHAEIVSLLLAHGADKTVKDRFGKTALDWAQKNKRNDIIGLLEKAE